jgi:hypothetical protein
LISYNPGVLQCRGKQRAGIGRGDASDGVRDRHADHVGERQRERARFTERCAFAGDDSGKDRDHRQHARREREQQPEHQETAEDQWRAVLEKLRHLEIGREDGYIAAASEGEAGSRLHGYVTNADVRATLRRHLQIERARGLRRDAHTHLLAVDLLLAEKLVFVRETRWKLGLAETRAGRLELHALPVQVVAVGDREAHLDRAVERLRREAERFLRLEQAVGRAQVEGGDRGLASEQQKEKQFFHLVSAATQSR